ncbi:hypothetical protein [Clostridium beijerinckii]|nr:hypothetical protein [Clostridium beijerinckii]NRZ12158.1 hypothetical protein [Clostridium beijerinckii]
MKKNFNKIPKHIANKLSEFKNSTITVFSFIKLTKEDIISEKTQSP